MAVPFRLSFGFEASRTNLAKPPNVPTGALGGYWTLVQGVKTKKGPQRLFRWCKAQVALAARSPSSCSRLENRL